MSTRILFLSHTHAFGPFRVGSHHYARVLARQGAEVVHLSTPVSAAHRATGRVDGDTARRLPRGPHRDEDGVTHLTPRTSLPRPYGSFTVAGELRRQGIDPSFDAVLIDQPLLWDRSVRTLAPRLIYRPTDLYPDGVKARLQQQITAAADGVIATSATVLDSLGPLSVPTLVLENGAETTRFVAPATAAGDEARPLVCAYVGALDARFDWQVVQGWARARPDVRFRIAGPGAARPGLPDNVEQVGPIPYAEVPTFLRAARVGILPLTDDVVNRGRSPMKLHEYLASGLAVLTRATPTLRADDLSGLYTYESSVDAGDALDRALAHPSPNRAGVSRAAASSWEAKTEALAHFLESLATR